MPAWIKSSHSASDSSACVEVLITDILVSVRDSKNPGGGQFGFAPDAWRAFLGSVSHGPDPAQ